MQKIAAFLIGTILLTGCIKSPEVTDHLEHHVPEHRPPNFAVAVAELERRRGELGSRPDFSRKLSEFRDIVQWLPELAAESDLPEKPWEQINQIAQTWTSRLRSFTEPAPPDVEEMRFLESLAELAKRADLIKHDLSIEPEQSP